MITIDGKEFRNLTEQVLKNKEDIAEIKGTDIFVNGLGIRVLGQHVSADDLPETADNYGDAYAIGGTAPFEFYVWTRANPDAGHDEDYWFNIGELAIVGPQGAQGPRGLKGDTGDNGKSVYAVANSVSPSLFMEGDAILITSGADAGNIYKKIDGEWSLLGNIKGPQGLQGLQGPQGIQGLQGLQGPQGPRGDSGGFINIHGIITSVGELPDPETLHDLTIAYLLDNQTTPATYNLYLQVGSTSAEAMWVDMGPLNVATYVEVNGNFVSYWDSDVKLDKKSDGGAYVYTHVGSSQSQQAYVGNSATPNSIAQRTNGGQIKVADPAVDGDAINKGYADGRYVPLSANVLSGQPQYMYVKQFDSTPGLTVCAKNTPGENKIPVYDEDACLKTSNPVSNLQCANKQYVDTVAANAQIPAHLSAKFTVTHDGQTDYLYIYYYAKETTTPIQSFFNAFNGAIGDYSHTVHISGWGLMGTINAECFITYNSNTNKFGLQVNGMQTGQQSTVITPYNISFTDVNPPTIEKISI